MRIRMTDKRERRLKQAMDAMDDKTKAGAIDRALSHYLADRQNKEQNADEQAKALSTPYLSMERGTTVGDK